VSIGGLEELVPEAWAEFRLGSTSTVIRCWTLSWRRMTQPLALDEDELDRIDEVVRTAGNDHLMVGFNRCLAPLLTKKRSVPVLRRAIRWRATRPTPVCAERTASTSTRNCGVRASR
jgi:hypothetical protein